MYVVGTTVVRFCKSASIIERSKALVFHTPNKKISNANCFSFLSDSVACLIAHNTISSNIIIKLKP